MSKISFSQKTKSILGDIAPKKGCCKNTEKKLKEALLPPTDFTEAEKVGERSLCSECTAAFLRIIFIEYGTVTEPSKSYHLEISVEDEHFRNYIWKTLAENVQEAKKGKRKNKFTVYYKNSGAIEDFFAFVGAPSVAFDMINLKLLKEVRNNINRVNNFDTANMQKSVNANAVYLSSVRYLAENGLLGSLSPELQETAHLRIENESLSMSQLAELHSESITKSGVKHRLDKILDFSKKAAENSGK